MSDKGSPWTKLQADITAPKQTGTKRDFANMQKEKPAVSKIGRMGTHWEMPKKLKLNGF